ncbi:hypothetical protein IFM89_011259 [Coptis chinensis]|uniref:cellulase n=1 Tax=Coptis chinensis TaxID=261450 RepID=A0A835HC98_9MAGN|nr:hypothetical protein IFM89_011259 [Coptis chinensis]
MSITKPFGVGLILVLLIQGVVCIDYGSALTKSLLYFEGQRSGKLPPNQRVTWRGDSGLRDGSDAKIDLVGGYYDAGDNVKFGLPMAYTITMLAWSVVEFREQLNAKNELVHALEAIKWGTDYLIKAHPEANVLYVEVGEGHSDHDCWQRPEDMTTPRPSYKIDASHPGSDVAGETAAALAAASMVFAQSDPAYASQLFTHAHEDELLWAAVWLHRASKDEAYAKWIDTWQDVGGVRTMFSWDDKVVGVQLYLAKLNMEGYMRFRGGRYEGYKAQLNEFICNCIQMGNKNVKKSSGGLLWWDPWNNLQYTASASFILTVYSKYLEANLANLQCAAGNAGPVEIFEVAKSQAAVSLGLTTAEPEAVHFHPYEAVDYILGANPLNMSFMVGFGNYPKKIHHRGASIVSITKDPAPVTCKGGYDTWFNSNNPNPNVLEGAIVGGPYDTDAYTDARNDFQQAEPATANTAPLVGVLAKLA